jgi:hypothetical protein
MFYITIHGFTLEQVLIMAALNIASQDEHTSDWL